MPIATTSPAKDSYTSMLVEIDDWALTISLDLPQARSAGGAVAQCRFSGRCAVPIATTAPVDGSPLPAQEGRTNVSGSVAWQPRGMTCDGSPAAAAPPASRRGGGAFMSKWRFDMQAWAWVPRDGGADAAAAQQSAKHQLAARRYVRIFVPHTASAKPQSPATVPVQAQSNLVPSDVFVAEVKTINICIRSKSQLNGTAGSHAADGVRVGTSCPPRCARRSSPQPSLWPEAASA